MHLNIFSTEICKTGFVLENQVAQQLKSAAWTVISNKYYVDDSEETIREIDLIAYRVGKVKHFDVYTVLIISCKKSDANVWALLARDINLKDPNSDWWPLHTWSNDKALNYQLSRAGKSRSYHERMADMGVLEALSMPSVEVFAFQEMDKKTGKPQNDKPIFSAVTSLMKAQAYEMSALPARKKQPAVYQFNLLSVVDTDLVKLMFQGEEIDASSIETEHYLARYIIRKKEIFSRVRFIKASAVETVLEDYGRLHQANCQWMGAECDTFYADIVKDWERNSVLTDDFNKKTKWIFGWRLEQKFGHVVDIGEISINWSDAKEEVWIGVSAALEVLDFMNQDERIRQCAAKALKEVYRYEDGFYFDDDIPF